MSGQVAAEPASLDLDRMLAEWIHPLGEAEFRTEYLGRRHLYREPTQRRLASIDALRRFTANDLLGEARNDVVAWFHGRDGRHLTAMVTPETARRLYAAGTTIYLPRSGTHEFAVLAGALARSLRVDEGRVTSAVFCNQAGATTRMHFDPIDTITVQITGSKRWRIAPNTHVRAPSAGWATLDPTVPFELGLHDHGPLPTTMPDGTKEYLLTPGAVLLVPRGYWHETTSDEESISLHIHHASTLWVDVLLPTLRSLLLSEERWRASADALWDPTGRQAALAHADCLLRELPGMVTGLAAQDLLPSEGPPPHTAVGAVRRWARAGYTVQPGPLADEAATADGDAVIVVCTSDYVTQRYTTVALPHNQVNAVYRLATAKDAGLTAQELAGLEPELSMSQATDLIRVLLDAGLLRPADTEHQRSDQPSPRD